MLIRRATSDDLRSLRVTAMRAFVDDPVMRWLYPEDEVFLAPDGAVFRSAFAGWVALGEVWCTDDAVGLAIWIPPGDPEIDFGRDPLAEPPPPELVERFEIFGAAKAEHTPDEPHWYLQVLATHPDWQRQGLGERLMTPTFERAGSEGLPCYLETEMSRTWRTTADAASRCAPSGTFPPGRTCGACTARRLDPVFRGRVRKDGVMRGALPPRGIGGR